MLQAEGRMIRKSISNSKKFAKLCPEAAVLFSMMIPHYNAHGKMNGGPGYIKDEICPWIPYLTTETIPDFLREISKKTSVKWFKSGGRMWIHAIHFHEEHQKLNPKRLGPDRLPSYSGSSPGVVTEYSESSPGVVQEQSVSSPGVVPPEVEVKEEEEREDKEEGKGKVRKGNPQSPTLPPKGGKGDLRLPSSKNVTSLINIKPIPREDWSKRRTQVLRELSAKSKK